MNQIYAPAAATAPQTEDELLKLWFGNETGYFVDVGAHDGRSYSNSRPLWERGWSGMLIEPCRSTFEKLLANYPCKDRLTFLNCAITPNGGPVQFFEHSDPDRSGWHSMCQEWVATWEPNTRKVTTVNSKRFDELSLPKSVDFLSIDVEGYDADLLEAMPESFRPRLIMFEVDKQGVRERGEREMARRGYKFVWGTYLNSAYASC